MQYGRTRVHPLNTYPRPRRMSGRARARALARRSWLSENRPHSLSLSLSPRIAEIFESFELIQPLARESLPEIPLDTWKQKQAARAISPRVHRIKPRAFLPSFISLISRSVAIYDCYNKEIHIIHVARASLYIESSLK